MTVNKVFTVAVLGFWVFLAGVCAGVAGTLGVQHSLRKPGAAEVAVHGLNLFRASNGRKMLVCRLFRLSLLNSGTRSRLLPRRRS
jgi:hypothetical protein